MDVYSYLSDDGMGEMGTLLISDSNGTTFSLSIDYTNRNDNNEVDFERMQGLRGTLLVNIVTNPLEVIGGADKTVVSRISFNDGGIWQPIDPPALSYSGTPYSCALWVSCSFYFFFPRQD